MKSKKALVITIITILLLALLLSFALLYGKRIPDNPSGTTGNTAGNLNNSGLFCEYDGKVYFSNSYDNGKLYSMDVNEGSIKKLINSNARNILAGGKYLYYFHASNAGTSGIGGLSTPKSLNRAKLNGKNAISLTRDIVTTAQLVDNYIYYLTTDCLFKKIRIDKTDETQLADYIINPACAANGVIYYNGTVTDHYLYALHTSSDVSEILWQGNLWYPVLDGDYVYYLDVEENYRLCRYSLSQNMVEVLTNDRVDCFNVGNGYVYYQKNGETPGLKCMRTDGSGLQIIAEGNYTNINLTSQFVYFQPFDDDTVTYHAPLGSTAYESFDSAMAAVLSE